MVKNGLLLTIFLSVIGVLGVIFIHIFVGAIIFCWSDNFCFNRCFNDLFA